jgi:periplasmic protein TonB
MDINQIQKASFLDILFEGRNKDYGAYELRSKYGKRLMQALIITAAMGLLFLLASFLSDKLGDRKKGEVKIQEVTLEEVNLEEKKNEPPPPPPPPKPPEPPKVEMAKFTPPKVVKDEEVKEDEKPPIVEELQDTKIGNVNQEGIKDEGIVAPPVDDKGGVVEAPKKDDTDYDQTFTKVEIEADFPGGDQAWNRYIKREIERYIDELQEDGKSGTCVVQFIVDREGNISDVEALTLKGSKLAEIATNAVKKGPKWKPAQQNGRTVKAYRKQPVTFQLLEEMP